MGFGLDDTQITESLIKSNISQIKLFFVLSCSVVWMVDFYIFVLFAFAFQDGWYPSCQWKRGETSSLHRNHWHLAILQVIIMSYHLVTTGHELYISQYDTGWRWSQITVCTVTVADAETIESLQTAQLRSTSLQAFAYMTRVYKTCLTSLLNDACLCFPRLIKKLEHTWKALVHDGVSF